MIKEETHVTKKRLCDYCKKEVDRVDKGFRRKTVCWVCDKDICEEHRVSVTVSVNPICYTYGVSDNVERFKEKYGPLAFMVFCRSCFEEKYSEFMKQKFRWAAHGGLYPEGCVDGEED